MALVQLRTAESDRMGHHGHVIRPTIAPAASSVPWAISPLEAVHADVTALSELIGDDPAMVSTPVVGIAPLPVLLRR